MEAYYNLAVAVILQAVNDIEHGPPRRRREARDDVAAGGLDRWVYIVAGDRHTLEAIMAKLRDLAVDAA